MRLQVKGKNLELSDSIRSYAEQKLQQAGQAARRPGAGRARAHGRAATLHSRNQVAEATVFTKGHSLRVREASKDMRASIDGSSTDKLMREVKEYQRQAPSRAAPPAPDHNGARDLPPQAAAREGLRARRACRPAGRGPPRAPWDKAGIHGGPTGPREWDDIATARRGARGRTGGVRRARRRSDRRIRAEGDRDVRGRSLARPALPGGGRAPRGRPVGRGRTPHRGRRLPGRRTATSSS